LTLNVSLLFLAGVVYLFIAMPKGFLPRGDTGLISASTEAAQGTSYESMVNYQKKVAGIVRQDPNIDAVMSSVGRGSSNTGNMMIRLKPRSERRSSADEVIQELRPKLAEVPGIQVYLQNPPPSASEGIRPRASTSTPCRARIPTSYSALPPCWRRD